MRKVFHRVGVIVLLVGLSGMVLDLLVWLVSHSWWRQAAWDFVLGIAVFLAIVGASAVLLAEKADDNESRTRQE